MDLMLSHMPAHTDHPSTRVFIASRQNDDKGDEASVCLTVEVQDGLTADRRVRQDQRLQTRQPGVAQLCRRLQAEVGDTLQLQHLQVGAATNCTQKHITTEDHSRQT